MAIEGIAEELADNLEEAAEATRRINTSAAGYILGGFVIGASIGFWWGYKFQRERIKAEAFRDSEVEVERVREIYRQKMMAATPKPSVDEVLEERGYSTAVEQEERPLPPPVPVYPPRVEPKSKDEGWNQIEELEARDPSEPYVIHQDEFNEGEMGYATVVYTYYAIDDVLCDLDNKPLPHADVIVGQDNLKWGHGADDIDVVFVRNDHLEIDMEICRIYKSFEEEVLGLNRNETEET